MSMNHQKKNAKLIFFFFNFQTNETDLFSVIFLSAREILPLWDKQIQSICYQVNGVIEKISAAEPDWLAKTLDEEMSN